MKNEQNQPGNNKDTSKCAVTIQWLTAVPWEDLLNFDYQTDVFGLSDY
jgi:hypothetical protein